MAITVHIGIRIRAPREFVFQHLLTAHHMARWFCNFAQFDMRGPTVGAKFRFGGDYAIAAADPPGWTCEILGGEVLRAVSFRWPLHGSDTRVDWRVDDAPDGSVMRVTHSALPAENPTCGTFQDGWRICLGNLKAIAEGRSDSLRPDSSPVSDPIKLDLLVDVPPPKVWAALLEPSHLKRWLASSNEPHVVAQPGGRYDLGDGVAGTISEFEPTGRLAITWAPGGVSKHLVLSFEEKSGGRCGVYTAHEGLVSTEREILLRFRCAWAERLVSLKNYMETGDTGFTEPYSAQITRE